jgi:predicted nuclease of predicted toxin-antitoxin system
MRFILDINVSPLTVTFLQEHGHDALRVSSVLPQNTSDSDILEYAREKNRVVLTNDLDFSDLIALNNHTAPSVLTLRLFHIEPEIIHALLLQALPSMQAAMATSHVIATLTEKSLRLRALPIRA